MIKVTNRNKKMLKILGRILFVIYILGLCFSWAISTEYNSAPDEEMKYLICEYICTNLNLPHGGNESIRNEIWGTSYGFTPFISYILSAGFMRLMKVFTQNSFLILIAARFASVLFITGYAIVCIKIASKLFKRHI